MTDDRKDHLLKYVEALCDAANTLDAADDEAVWTEESEDIYMVSVHLREGLRTIHKMLTKILLDT